MSTATPLAALFARTPKRRSRKTWLTRGVSGAGIAILGLGALGALYQVIATASDRRTFLPPGKLVNIGGPAHSQSGTSGRGRRSTPPGALTACRSP